MYVMYARDHYEPGEWEQEFSTLEDALTAAERVRDDGGDATVLDEDGNEY